MTITKTYNVGNLMEDLKGLYKIAGLKGQPVAFIFTCALLRVQKSCYWPLPINCPICTQRGPKDSSGVSTFSHALAFGAC